MTPLPAALGGKDLVAWRLDMERHAAAWDRGEGAFRFGGRWNSRGIRAVYCSIDPAAAILEVAVHKGFRALDIVAHVLTEVEIIEPKSVYVVRPADVPNPNWLVSGLPSAGQQEFGNELLKRHPLIVIPSAVSRRSWNLVFNAETAPGTYRARSQQRFALDTRLNPPPRSTARTAIR